MSYMLCVRCFRKVTRQEFNKLTNDSAIFKYSFVGLALSASK